VGGIGIMNNMLVSGRAHARIGLRKAVGRATCDIMAQFLVEMLVLSLTGGGRAADHDPARQWRRRATALDPDRRTC
jgi:hypothetical protein